MSKLLTCAAFLAVASAAVPELCKSKFESECDATSLLTVKMDVHKKGKSAKHATLKPTNMTQDSTLSFLQSIWNSTMDELMQGAKPIVYEDNTGHYYNSDKLVWILMSFFFGFCGFDRCYLGQFGWGIAKGLTFGGCCGIGAMVDWYICLFNCLLKYDKVTVFFFAGYFKEKTIDNAFWVSIFMLFLTIIQMCQNAAGVRDSWTEEWKAIAAENQRRAERGEPQTAADDIDAPMRHRSIALLPTAMTKQLRKAGLVTEEPTLPELTSAFAAMDLNKDGLLDADEIKSGLSAMGVSDEKIAKIIESADKNGDGKISKDEFLAVYGFGKKASKKKGAAEAAPEDAAADDAASKKADKAAMIAEKEAAIKAKKAAEEDDAAAKKAAKEA